jgi:hypothetical protein
MVSWLLRFLAYTALVGGVWCGVLWAVWSLIHGQFGPPIVIVSGAVGVRLLPTPWDWVARIMLHIYH